MLEAIKLLFPEFWLWFSVVFLFFAFEPENGRRPGWSAALLGASLGCLYTYLKTTKR